MIEHATCQVQGIVDGDSKVRVPLLSHQRLEDHRHNHRQEIAVFTFVMLLNRVDLRAMKEQLVSGLDLFGIMLVRN